MNAEVRDYTYDELVEAYAFVLHYNGPSRMVRAMRERIERNDGWTLSNVHVTYVRLRKAKED